MMICHHVHALGFSVLLQQHRRYRVLDSLAYVLRRGETREIVSGNTNRRVGWFRNSSSYERDVCLCHRTLGFPFRYAARVDLAPLAVRPSAFGDGFPLNWTAPGMPGIGMDFVLSHLVWDRGWHVVHLPTPAAHAERFVEVRSRPRGVGNSQGKVRDSQWDAVQEVLNRRFSFESAAKMATKLNQEQTVQCADGGGDGGEWRSRAQAPERRVDAPGRPMCSK